MERGTRVQKYAKLREDIDNIDVTILENLQKEKLNVVKESMKHGSDSGNTFNSTNLSIDDILEGHTKYVDLDNYHYKKEKIKPKKNLFILIGLIFVVVVTLVVIAIFRR